MSASGSELPSVAEIGMEGTWELVDRYGSTITLNGDFLGFGSSHRPSHNHLFPPYAVRKQHCSTCRWTEKRIFQEHTGDRRYLIVSTGQSIVPGEKIFVTFGWLATGAEVVESLVSWEGGRPSLDFVAERAISRAAEYDDSIHLAYQPYAGAAR